MDVILSLITHNPSAFKSNALVHKNAALCSRVTKSDLTDPDVTSFSRALQVKLLVVVLFTSQQ